MTRLAKSTKFLSLARVAWRAGFCFIVALGGVAQAGDRELLDLALRTPEERNGDYDALARVWLEALPSLAADPRAEILPRRLVSILPFVADRSALTPLLEKALETVHANGTTTQALIDLLGDRYLEAGRVQDQALLQRARGYLGQWFIAGPFGKSTLAPFHTAFPPEAEAKLEATYVDGWQKIRWRKILQARPEPQVNPAEHMFPGQGVSYLVTHVEAREPLAAALVRGSQERLRIWLNGVLVVDDDPFARRLESRRATPVRLAKGWNRLLVKTQAPFWLRLAEPSGNSFPAGTWREESALAWPALPPSADTAVTHTVEVFGLKAWRLWADELVSKLKAAETATEEARRLAADAQLGLALLTQVYGRDELAVAAVQKALELLPRDAWVQYHAGEVFRGASYLPATIAKDRSLKAFQAAHELDGDLLPAHERLAKFLEDDNKPALAARQVLDALDKRPEFLRGLLRLSSIYGRKRWEAEQIEVMRKIEALAPSSTAPALFWADHFTARHLPRQALDWYQKASALDQSEVSLWLRRAGLHKQVGELTEAEATLRQALSMAPDSTRVALTLAELATDQGRYDEAIALTREIAGKNPQSPAGELALVGIYLRADRAVDATASLRRALELDPGNAAARRSIARLASSTAGQPVASPTPIQPGEDFWTPYDEKLEDWVLQIPETGPLVDKAASVTVLDLMVVRVAPDGSTTEYVHQASKLLSEESKDDLARVQTAGEILLLRTLTPEGESLEPVPGQGERSWVMPAMTRGALVEYAYRDESSRRQGPLRVGTFYFQDTRMRQSFLLSRYVLILPKGFNGAIDENNLLRDPSEQGGSPELAKVQKTVRDLPDGGKVVIYEARNVERLEREQFMPDPEEYVPNVTVRPQQTWEEIANAVRDNYRGATLPTPELEAAAREAVKDATDPLDRARAIYGWVQANVPTSSATSQAVAVLLEKSGDRTVLLKSLLNLAGLPATWAYLRPKEAMLPKADWSSPQLTFFRYPHVALDLGTKGPLYLSLQDRQAPFGRLPEYLEGGKALILSERGHRIESVESQRAEEHAVKITARLELEDSVDVACSVELSILSTAGYGQKEQLKTLPAFQKDVALRQFANQLFRGARVKTAEFKNLEETGQPLAIVAVLTAPKLLQKSGEDYLLKPVFQPSQLVKTFAGGAKREHPFHFRSQRVVRDSIRIGAGDKFKLERTPRDVTLINTLGTYALNYKTDGDDLVVTREVTLLPGRLAASDHAAFVELCEKVDAAERESVVFRKL